jgi:hypothetical protein
MYIYASILTAVLKHIVHSSVCLICSVIAAPLAARQAAHAELFGRPCRCSRCTLEATLPQETAQQLQALHDRAESEWPQRLQAALEAAEDADPEETAEVLADLQVGSAVKTVHGCR